jgi:hypothetical protein
LEQYSQKFGVGKAIHPASHQFLSRPFLHKALASWGVDGGLGSDRIGGEEG